MIKFFQKDNLSWNLFLSFIFAVGISMPIARILLILTLVATIFDIKNKKLVFGKTYATYGWLIYLALAIVVTGILCFTSTDTQLNTCKGFSKITKLIWYIGIPVVATQINTEERFYKAIRFFVYGCLVTALYVILLNPILAYIQVTMPGRNTVKLLELGYQYDLYGNKIVLTPAQSTLLSITDNLGITDWVINDWINKPYRPRTLTKALSKLGSMSDAQRLMVGTCAALVLLVRQIKEKKEQVLKYLIFFIISLLGLVLTLKRGTLFACILVCVPIAIKNWKKTTILSLIALATFVVAFPSTRARMLDLRSELSSQKGGRYTMWTQIVPELHKQHPWGIGFRALTDVKMHAIANNVEARQNHVHSSLLQAFVDFSFFGIVAYLLWFYGAMYLAIRKVKTHSPYIIFPLIAITSLNLFGLIEYNIADADIVLIYCIVLGLAECYFIKNIKYT